MADKAQEICIACQKCCKQLYIKVAYRWHDEQVKEFFKARGFGIAISDDGFILLVSNDPCPHLTKNGCDIYETRPEICRLYYGYNDDLLGAKECMLENQ